MILFGYQIKAIAKSIVDHIDKHNGAVFLAPERFTRANCDKLAASLPDHLLLIPAFGTKEDQVPRPGDRLFLLLVGTNPAALWNYWHKYLDQLIETESISNSSVREYYRDFTSSIYNSITEHYKGIQLEAYDTLERMK